MMDKAKVRVGVLMGGLSSERPISLKSGAGVLEALQSRGWNAVGIDVGRDLPARLVAQGVHGYVDKAAPLSYVLQAVESLMEGGMFFATHIPPKGATGAEQAALPRVAAGAKAEVSGVSIEAVKILSSREIEVAQLVAEGFSSKEVASRLDLSVRTVEKHRANIMDKIGVREVASLVRWCVHAGLVKR